MRCVKYKIASPENPRILTCDVLPNERYIPIGLYTLYGKLNPALQVLDSILPVQVSDSVLTGIGIGPLKNMSIGIGLFSGIGASLEIN